LNYKKTLTFKAFKKSKYFSLKYINYFSIYDSLLNKFRNKKIIFVEIGVFSGGSLFMWRSFFGKKAKIIGIDLNPDIKRFEKYGFDILIGDQSSKKFWNSFFKKYGKVDIILDDGGHTNYQQIKTVNSCVPNIRDGGILITEDVHTSYIKNKWYNPSRYSFINYSKKLIDDINSRYPGLKKQKFSLNKYIHSIQSFESITAFNIDRRLSKINKEIRNNKISTNPKEFRTKLKKGSFFYKLKSLFNTKTNFTYLIFLINSLKLRNFFK
jgi:hypothetical protein